ncbi:nucleotide kinase domain-containing protein [Fodinibius salsisoli]|uniref:5-hmdU DNA kinase helical domain-containing protein n=1 Tax=Fodinibius salsisoli TaxID=2820877 RepID=A0ABT3PSM0_9BACT|nr:nucleotide kinase domain-containing protein [Fodinibius salsisoli]MCW9708848.1 hypothetical protein [Fodinibius salsisoli]
MQQTDLNLTSSNKTNKSGLFSINKKLAPAKPTEVYNTYWRFAAKRQRLFFKKISKKYPPWTDDPILNKYKFTNAYRASDRVSQYLIKNVIYSDSYSLNDLFFRIILFKIFNKIETWELLKSELGEINYNTFEFDAYDRILTEAQASGQAIYSAAYIMASGKSAFGYSKKHRNHLTLVAKMMQDKLPERIASSETMQEAFILLKSYPSIGDFLAYQYVTDINYSNITSFSEKEFVVPGPGAIDGIHKCFSDLGGISEIEIIKMMYDNQDREFERLGLNYKSLWGRPLMLIDCQNLFCEVDKYARVAHPNIKGKSDRKRIKQKYSPTKDKFKYWYPPHWEINGKVEDFYNEIQ